MSTPALEVLRPGVRTLVQDAGRTGFAELGISASGAWDRQALQLGNRLVGNEPDAAALEVLLGQFAVRAVGDQLVAVTGAPVPVDIDGRVVDPFAPLVLRDGQVLTLGSPSHGLRSYLCLRGGVGGEAAFGSLASDPTRGLGPAPLRVADVVSRAERGGRTVASSHLAVSSFTLPDELVLHAVLGPRDDWFTPAAVELFATTAWQVTQETDRVGTRLAGPALERSRPGELTSEATVRGAVQVPTSGQPVVFGPDHPTTGGYPVVAVVDPADADLLSQARPGQLIRFRTRRVSLD